MVKVFVEGGAPGALKQSCRKAFTAFLCNASVQREKFRIFASGSRQQAFEDFCTSVGAGESAMLLVDSEEHIADHHQSNQAGSWDPWGHLSARAGDGWSRPTGSEPLDCHLMVQTMESWLLCDSAVLASYFGNGFAPSAILQTVDIETASKYDVNNSLERATQLAQTKGKYRKGRDSFALLAEIDPLKVQARSRWARRFVEAMRSK
jgi:Domain of unknown function (DUF4276)